MTGLSRRKFLTGSALAAVGGTLALAGCAPSGKKDEGGAGSAKSAAGMGSGMGKHGTFNV
ncbi:MAG: twin-arginine translocation signal domain-containing protein, partial [Clostridia bacterium]|nr:twin-arginine translocation signal domain-containing protein [Clostridia bacterium]